MATDPARAEVDRPETIEVEWEGLKLTLPPSPEDWSADALEAFETGKAVAAIRGVFGSAEYDRIRADFAKAHGRELKVRDLSGLLDVIAREYGFGGTGE